MAILGKGCSPSFSFARHWPETVDRGRTILENRFGQAVPYVSSAMPKWITAANPSTLPPRVGLCTVGRTRSQLMDRLQREGELADLDREHDCPATRMVLPVELCEQLKQIPHHDCTDVSASG